MQLIVTNRHSTVAAHLLRSNLSGASVCTFDAHLDTGDSPRNIRRRIGSRLPTHPDCYDGSFNCGCARKPINSTNLWSACSAYGIVDRLVWICPAASTIKSAKLELLRVLAMQKCWSPEKLLEFYESDSVSITLDNLSICAMPHRLAQDVLQAESFDVIDVCLDFFYDPQRDAINDSVLNSYASAIKFNAHKAEVFSVAKSEQEGYCPRSLTRLVDELRGASAPLQLMDGLSKIGDALPESGGLAAENELPKLHMRYNSRRHAGYLKTKYKKGGSLANDLPRAVAAIRSGDIKLALRIYSSLNLVHPDDWRIRYDLGICADKMDDQKTIADAAKSANLAEGLVAEICYLKSLWKFRSKDGAAYTDARRAANFAPCWGAPHMILAAAAREVGKIKLAATAERQLEHIAALASSLLQSQQTND